MTIRMTGARSPEDLWGEYMFYVLLGVQAVLMFACYAVGYHMSSVSDGIPVARAGALATAISVGFTLWRYGDILKQGNQMSKDQFGRVIDSMNVESAAPRTRRTLRPQA